MNRDKEKGQCCSRCGVWRWGRMYIIKGRRYCKDCKKEKDKENKELTDKLSQNYRGMEQ